MTTLATTRIAFDFRLEFGVWVAALACACAMTSWSGPAGSGNGTPLGSEGCMPTPDRPIGFRGDGTGRYLGANPPVEWYRRAVGLAYELGCQAKKPSNSDKGSPIGNWFPYRYRYVTEWALLGPVPVNGGGLDEETVPNEKSLEPSPGEKAGGLTWMAWAGKPWMKVDWYRKVPPSSKKSIEPPYNKDKCDTLDEAGYSLHPETEIGFWETADKHPQNAVYYAATYLYAPRAGAIDIVLSSPPPNEKTAAGDPFVKIFVNGEEKFSNKLKEPKFFSPKLKQGWNRLLVKILKDKAEPPRLSVTIWPNFDDLTYETKNIKWVAPIPRSNPGTAIVVGDKLFTATDDNGLICLRRSDGHALWSRTSTLGHAAEKSKAPAQLAEVDQLDKQLVDAINDFMKANPPTSKQAADKVREAGGKKEQLWKGITSEMVSKGDEFKIAKDVIFGGSGSKGASGYTPCSDGKYVCVTYASGLSSCFDLDGNRKWTRLISLKARQGKKDHHGDCAFPLIAEGKFVVYQGSVLTAYDLETGNAAWEVDGCMSCNQSPVAFKAGNTTLVADPGFSKFVRASDGKVIWSGKAHARYVSSPVVCDGIIYVDGKHEVSGDKSIGVRIPASESAAANGPEILFKFPAKFDVASPLIQDGLAYMLNNTRALLKTFDSKTGTPVYSKPLPLHAYQHCQVGGIYASPSAGGKNIYITDNYASTVVLAPGKEYKELARNILDAATPPKYGPVDISDNTGAPGGGPTFHGDSIYFRTARHLYCISEK